MANTLKLVNNSNEILDELFKKLNIKTPAKLTDLSNYKEIENFCNAEYIYCIAYEMLIRTNDYNNLLEKYKPFKNKSKEKMTKEEFISFRKLVDDMNNIGLTKSSFLGFDCDDNDHVFKRNEYYNEVKNSPWGVRKLDKFKLKSGENIFYKLGKFYLEKGKLFGEGYKNTTTYSYLLDKDGNEDFLNKFEKLSRWKTQEEYEEFSDFLCNYCIKVIDDLTKEEKLKFLGRDTIYLSELDKDFLSQLEEEQVTISHTQIKLEYTHDNINFWKNYSLNDIKDGLDKLIEYYIKKGHFKVTKDEIVRNLSSFYVPAVNRPKEPISIEFDKDNELIDSNFTTKFKEYEGIDLKVKENGVIVLKEEHYFYELELNQFIPLRFLSNDFLSTLNYEDLEHRYIETEPIFSRPRLMFNEARLTNIPINLNLSKEDLLIYISKIKDEYDKDKKIVKTDIEYFFDLEIESDNAEMPNNIKYVDEKSKTSRHNVTNRKDLKTNFAMGFYIYDIYKVLVPYKKESSEIIDEIINLFEFDNNNSIENLKEKITTYLNILKEFIHGVNKEKEKDLLKRDHYKDSKPESKYRNLIIGKSYISKSNFSDLRQELGL